MYDNACLITYNATAELTSLEVIYIHIYGHATHCEIELRQFMSIEHAEPMPS